MRQNRPLTAAREILTVGHSTHPIERFEASLGDGSERVRDAFYRANFEDLMGPVIDRVPVPA